MAYETQDFNLPRDIADQLSPPVTEYLSLIHI